MSRGNGSTAGTPAEQLASLMEIFQSNVELSATGDKVKGISEQDSNSRKMLAMLDALGGQSVGEDSLVFTGQQFVLPAAMENDLPGAVRYLEDWDRQQNTTFRFARRYNHRPYDGAAAFERAMKRVFGTSGIGKATAGFFGSTPPQYLTVASGPDTTMQVPWGEVTFSPISAEFELGYTADKEFGFIFELSVTAPRRHRRRVEGFFSVVEDELAKFSIYKGRAISADALEPKFLDTSTVDESKIIYRPDVLTQLDVNLWTPMRHAQSLREAGVPIKRAVLVEGPNGTGKTLAGLRSAQIAQENGWTFIMVPAGEDPLEALKTARIYAPALVWVEDLDVIAATDAAGTSRKKVSRLLDALDGLQGKGSEVMAGFTTNFVDKLDKGVLRPGRLDAVIHVAELDAAGYEKLVRSLIAAERLAPDLDMTAVVEQFISSKMLPSFAAEATLRSVRYSIARNEGRAGVITTADLIDAARGMQAHLDLMDRAQHTGTDVLSIDDLFTELVQDAVTGMKGRNERFGEVRFEVDEDAESK